MFLKKKYLLPLLFFTSISFSQIKDTFYVNDVKTIEYVTVNYSVDKNGQINKVILIPKMTTYKNDNALKKVTSFLKNFEYELDSELINNNIDFTFLFVNKKYENSTLDESDYSKCSEYKTGQFRYKDVRVSETEINRGREIQKEKNNNIDAELEITWNNPCEYELEFINVRRKENQYLIGVKMKTKIIGLLKNSYIYKTNSNGMIFVGELIKIN